VKKRKIKRSKEGKKERKYQGEENVEQDKARQIKISTERKTDISKKKSIYCPNFFLFFFENISVIF
jgi:hypothetical protein